jgi:hypothetical protein
MILSLPYLIRITREFPSVIYVHRVRQDTDEEMIDFEEEEEEYETEDEEEAEEEEEDVVYEVFSYQQLRKNI